MDDKQMFDRNNANRPPIHIVFVKYVFFITYLHYYAICNNSLFGYLAMNKNIVYAQFVCIDCQPIVSTQLFSNNWGNNTLSNIKNQSNKMISSFLKYFLSFLTCLKESHRQGRKHHCHICNNNKAMKMCTMLVGMDWKERKNRK